MRYESGIELVDYKNKDVYLMGEFAANCIQVTTDNRIVVIGYDITEIMENMDYPRIEYGMFF